ncbi:MAG TPA: transposase [Candidatus Ozemobacteraceae bacterium]
MPKTRPPYPLEFRQQLVDLVLAGRSPEDLAKEFEPSAVTIRNWVTQAKRDGSKSPSGLSLTERDELTRLRRENKRLRVEREILSKAAAWFARETNSIPDKSSNS